MPALGGIPNPVEHLASWASGGWTTNPLLRKAVDGAHNPTAPEWTCLLGCHLGPRLRISNCSPGRGPRLLL